MTREEVTKILRDIYCERILSRKEMKAVETAYKTLEQEPCEDCISRAEAIKALGYDISIESDEGMDAYKTVIKEMLCKIYDVQKENIEKLPSIKPKTDVLDKIRAEIREEMLSHSGTGEEVIQAYADGLKKGLKIINKYKAESEE